MSDLFTLYIEHLGVDSSQDEFIKLEVPQSQSISDLKNEIFKLKAIPFESQILMSDGVELDDNWKFSQFNAENKRICLSIPDPKYICSGSNKIMKDPALYTKDNKTYDSDYIISNFDIQSFELIRQNELKLEISTWLDKQKEICKDKAQSSFSMNNQIIEQENNIQTDLTEEENKDINAVKEELQRLGLSKWSQEFISGGFDKRHFLKSLASVTKEDLTSWNISETEHPTILKIIGSLKKPNPEDKIMVYSEKKKSLPTKITKWVVVMSPIEINKLNLLTLFREKNRSSKFGVGYLECALDLTQMKSSTPPSADGIIIVLNDSGKYIEIARQWLQWAEQGIRSLLRPHVVIVFACNSKSSSESIKKTFSSNHGIFCPLINSPEEVWLEPAKYMIKKFHSYLWYYQENS